MYQIQDSNFTLENQEQDERAEEIAKFLNFIRQPGEVHEFRCPKAGKWRTVSGYFNDPAKMAKDAAHWNGQVPAVYYTLNPVKPALLARCCNRSQGYAEHTANDADIERRRNVLIDTDPTRPAGISSTDEEHDLALAKSDTIADWLADQGFPDGIRADSGNGGHLLLAVDMPHDKHSTDLVQRFLLSLAQRFNDETGKVDTTVFNSSRISKLYGTLTMKGDNTTDRPHRYAKVLSYPSEYKVVPVELLEKVANEYKPSTNAPTVKTDKPAKDGHDTSATESVEWVKRFLEGHAIEHSQKSGGGRWLARFELSACPFCNQAGAAVLVGEDGTKCFKCQHGHSCNQPAKHTWRDFRKHYEPDWQPDEQPSDEDGLLEAIRSACELWHSPDWKSYATMPSGGHLPVEGSSFARWITALALDTTGRGLSKSKLDTLVSTCSAVAVHKGDRHEVHRRVARLGDVIEIDLGDDTFEAVIITPDSWAIGKPSARFVRSDNAAALPRPVRGGSLDLLRPLVNLSEEQFPLFVGSLLDAYKGHSPYLITAYTGEQGTSKSTLVRMERKLIDPVHKAELASCPKEERDLAVRAENNYFLAYDNIGKIPGWLSDAFCRVSTGGGFTTRSLFTNSEETIMDLCRPLALNGIEDFVVAGDLINRTVNIRPEVIPEEERKEETAFWADFNAVEPLVLGILYDALSAGLRNLRSVSLPKLPRMADSAKWIAACFPALGWTYEDWHAPYEAANNEAVMGSLENDYSAIVLIDWFKDKTDWTGSPAQLYAILKEHSLTCLWTDQQRYFSNTANHLTNKLRRSAPALRQHGIDYSRAEKKVKIDGMVINPIRIVRKTVAGSVAGCRLVAGSENRASNPENTIKQGENEKRLPVAGSFDQLDFSRKKKEKSVSVDIRSENRIMVETPATGNLLTKTAIKQGENGLPAQKTEPATNRQPTNDRQPDGRHPYTGEPMGPIRRTLTNGVVMESIPSRLGFWQVGKETGGRMEWLADTGDWRWAETRGKRLAKTGK